MKRLIYQVAVGKQSKLYEWCIASVVDYCKKYDIDHIVQREPILKIGPEDWDKSNRSANCKNFGYLPIYEKENAFAYFNQYDQIGIVDADIFIRSEAPNIFDDVHLHSDFAAVIEREMPITGKYLGKIVAYSAAQYSSLKDVDWSVNKHGHEFYNMGLMIMNKSIFKYIDSTPEEFIRRPEFKRFVDGLGRWKWSTDQTLLNYWVRKTGMNQQHLSWKWNALFKGVHDKYIKDAYFIHFFLKNHLPNKGEDIELLKRQI